MKGRWQKVDRKKRYLGLNFVLELEDSDSFFVRQLVSHLLVQFDSSESC